MLEVLAQQIARDGEGARKLITIDVEGAANEDAADADRAQHRQFAAGEDRDRRLRSELGPHSFAAGNAGVAFDPAQGGYRYAGRAGLPRRLGGRFLRSRTEDASWTQPECSIRFAIRGKGKGDARFWTCDFTEGYIRINASYRT